MQSPAINGGDHRRASPAPPAHPWVALRYPPAVFMPHQMVPPPHHYAAPFHHRPPPASAAAAMAQLPLKQNRSVNGAEDEENRTIWVGDLDCWMDENYLYSCFSHTGEIACIKLIRNKHTGLSEGYGFVEFYTHEAADGVLQSLSGHIMPNADHHFRLNWAAFGMGDKRSEVVLDYSIFVGDLASDVTDSLLQETFANKYSSVKGAKVVIDANTGRSKGYGFVRFGDENERKLSLTEMNGVYCSTRPMRIGLATPRKSSGGYGSNNGSSTPIHQSDGDSSNTTVFVGGLGPDVTEDDLKKVFSQYGDVASVKIPAGKQCGFVLFAHRNSAEEALQQLNGKAIGNQTVRLSWGRNPAHKQTKAEHGSWNSGYYGGNYSNGYAYALPPHYPGMYAPAYGAYALYGNQQPVN